MIDYLKRYDWIIGKFQHSPKNYYKSLDNQRQFLDHISVELNVNNLDDWYNITATEFRKRGGDGVLHHYNGSISKMLKTLYPEYLCKQEVK